MNAARWIYRTRQFLQALETSNKGVGRSRTRGQTRSQTRGLNPLFEEARAILPPSQFTLFNRLQTSEQTHSLRVLQALQAQGENQPDLLAAALLHDVGKTRFPLRLWERVLIVLVQGLSPGYIKLINFIRSFDSTKKTFLVAENHPAWGAELAESAGASPLTLALIGRHQEKLSALGTSAQAPSTPFPLSLEDQLLCKLQAVDDES